ncbi:nhl repeat-containing protein, putative [Entamoeba dispar SAW760]|uniref:Nhl repeat-containing protein, putative n=1 Tax=Entamoeba dispar (strain ATCC PRA-260 / SAW760) TaxID=370354 RepID=B0EGR8_ENTDS|nr:nhl repeat-containing protein, putative [Entamoeba dispar SAW760]EDR26280.1 nhl repeat-containing protein, putative [Entamoeba dispar SAW760]|eukprot:EDR26280.1 nhl repeat-containing protein, putative [Entamoeba dispar SAW760]
MTTSLTISSIETLFKKRKDELELQYQMFNEKKEQLMCIEFRTTEMVNNIKNLSNTEECKNNTYYQTILLKCLKSLQHIKEMRWEVIKCIQEIYNEIINLTFYINTIRYRNSLLIGIQKPSLTITCFNKNGAIDTNHQTLHTKFEGNFIETFISDIREVKFSRLIIPRSSRNHFSPAFSCITIKSNEIYITGDINNHSIKLITIVKDRKLSEEFPLKVEYPTCVVEYKKSSLFYISDKQLHCVFIFNKKNGKISIFGGYGNEPGKFNEPMCIAIDSLDNVYVADAMNCRIQIFTLDGTYLSSLSIPNQRTPFYPHCILFDEDQLIVIDNWGSSIFSIDPKQKKVTSIISRYGGAKGFVNRPTFACIDKYKRLFVSDSGNNRIACFKKNNFLGSIEMTTLGLVGAPLGISVNDKKLIFSTTANEPYLNCVSIKNFPNPTFIL